MNNNAIVVDLSGPYEPTGPLPIQGSFQLVEGGSGHSNDVTVVEFVGVWISGDLRRTDACPCGDPKHFLVKYANRQDKDEGAKDGK